MNCLTKCEAPKVNHKCMECPYNKGYSLCRFLDKMRTLECPNFNTVHAAQIQSLTPISRVTGVFATTHDTCGEIVIEDCGELSRKNILTSSKLESYIDAYGEINTELDTDLYKQKLYELTCGKVFPIPFKIGQAITIITPEVNLSKFATLNGKITGIGSSVEVKKQGKGKLIYQDVCRFNLHIDGKNFYVPATQLGDFFVLSDGVNIEGVINCRPVIALTQEGFIKPIDIKYQNEEIIIDNSYIYLKHKDLTVIGMWRHNRAIFNTSLDSLVSKKLLRFINKTLETVSVYKDSMLPYWLCDAMEINITK